MGVTLELERETALPSQIEEDEIRALDAKYVMGTYGRQPVTFVHGSGLRVWDIHGKEYLDFLGGLAVTSVGHCHPRVVQAMQEQAAELMHMSNLYLTVPQAKLAAKLAGHSDFEKTFFCNSGAEANEAAIKIARKHGKSIGGEQKHKIVTAERSFHGRTMGTLSATGQPKYQTSFTPLVPGFDYVPFNDVAALEASVSDDTCAIMLEPVLGESGVYVASQAFLQAARRLCDKHGALLILDEVQTGLGRTGTWWAYQQYGIIPDIMTVAKGLAGGVPIGACLARGAASTTLVPGDHGSTFAGNPFATRTALAVIETIEREELVANAKHMGEYFVAGLQEPPIMEHVSEIRHMGLMIGVELKSPDAKRIQSLALQNGLILNAVGDTTLRFLPPLIVQVGEIDSALEILARCSREI